MTCKCNRLKPGEARIYPPMFCFRYVDAEGQARTGVIPTEHAATEGERILYVEGIIRREFLHPVRRSTHTRRRMKQGEFRLYQPQWYFHWADADGRVHKKAIPVIHRATEESRTDFVRSFLRSMAAA